MQPTVTQQRCDLIELFSPPRSVEACEALSLSCGPSFDLCTGWDLAQPSTQSQVLSMIKEHAPRMVIMSAPCTEFSAITRMWNRKRRSREENAQRLHHARVLLGFSMVVAKQQMDMGNYFIHEHPAGASSWKEGCVASLLEKANVSRVTFDMCRFKMRPPGRQRRGGPFMRKRTSLMTNLDVVKSRFQGKLCNCKRFYNINGQRMPRS